MLTSLNDYISLLVLIFISLASFRFLVSSFKNHLDDYDQYSFGKYDDNEDE